MLFLCCQLPFTVHCRPTGIPAGEEFEASIRNSIGASRVFLVVIGSHWLDALDEHGNRKLDNPDDFVRRELELALRYRHAMPPMRIVPIVLDTATMPTRTQLPESLQDLADIQAYPLHSDRYFSDGMDALIQQFKVIMNATI